MSDLTVEKIEQLTQNSIPVNLKSIQLLGDSNECTKYISDINALETENKQLRQRIRELEEKLEFEALMDDDLK